MKFMHQKIQYQQFTFPLAAWHINMVRLFKTAIGIKIAPNLLKMHPYMYVRMRKTCVHLL